MDNTTKVELEHQSLLEQNSISIDDYQLPKTVLNRLVKSVFPPGYQLQSEAKTAIGRSAVTFISYITAIALELAYKHHHKNITANDLIDALDEAELSEFGQYCRDALAFMKQHQLQKRIMKKTGGNSSSSVIGGNSGISGGESISDDYDDDDDVDVDDIEEEEEEENYHVDEDEFDNIHENKRIKTTN